MLRALASRALTGFFSLLTQGLNSMFEVYLVGNNSHHFIISPTSVQGKADIRIRVAIPLDYETVDRYNFDVSPLKGRGQHRPLQCPLQPLPILPSGSDLEKPTELWQGLAWASPFQGG